MMVAHSCILVILTWCLALCRDLKKALIDQSGPHLADEVTETPRGVTFEQSGYPGLFDVRDFRAMLPSVAGSNFRLNSLDFTLRS